MEKCDDLIDGIQVVRDKFFVGDLDGERRFKKPH